MEPETTIFYNEKEVIFSHYHITLKKNNFKVDLNICI